MNFSFLVLSEHSNMGSIFMSFGLYATILSCYECVELSKADSYSMLTVIYSKILTKLRLRFLFCINFLYNGKLFHYCRTMVPPPLLIQLSIVRLKMVCFLIFYNITYEYF